MSYPIFLQDFLIDDYSTYINSKGSLIFIVKKKSRKVSFAGVQREIYYHCKNATIVSLL